MPVFTTSSSFTLFFTAVTLLPIEIPAAEEAVTEDGGGLEETLIDVDSAETV